MQVFAGLFTEGSTDLRFFDSIVRRTMEELAFECRGQIDIEVVPLPTNQVGDTFVEQIFNLAIKAHDDYGVHLLCLHVDADAEDHTMVFERKIKPALDRITESERNDICKNIVPLIPVQMMEAWMLADRQLLRTEIGTDMSDTELRINHPPESFANPKQVISDAIVTARAGLTKRRRKELSISDLYLPIGEQLSLDQLKNLSSYANFRNNLENSFRQMNLMED
jgi:hypothetical protein